MFNKNISYMLGLVALGLSAVACNVAGDTTAIINSVQGTVTANPLASGSNARILMTDKPASKELQDVTSVNVTYTEVKVHQSATDDCNNTDATAGNWVVAYNDPAGVGKTIDLLKLADDKTELLGDIKLEAGKHYEQIRFAVSKIQLLFSDSSTADVALPGNGHNSYIRVNLHGFTPDAAKLAAGVKYGMVIDFNVDKAIKGTGKPAGVGNAKKAEAYTYRLKPFLKVKYIVEIDKDNKVTKVGRHDADDDQCEKEAGDQA